VNAVFATDVFIMWYGSEEVMWKWL